MLVLSRRRNEKIKIGEQITVTVLDVQDGKVRLGIDAPREIPVDRMEIWEAKQTAKEESGDDEDRT